MYSLLIVDDELHVCRILQDLFLREGYKVFIAENGAVALEVIKNNAPDLIISDIQMPVMDGFELFGIIRRDFPHIKHVMMTSFDIDQYIDHIKRYNIGNVLAKGSDFNLSEVSRYIKALLEEDIFGMRRYFPTATIYEEKVRSYAEAKSIYSRITDNIPRKKSFFLEIALDELISNAIFHGALEVSSLPREEWTDDMIVPESYAVKVSWCGDNDKVGVSVEDPRGNLKKNDVLKWLTTSRDSENGDEHGRGFLLVRKIIDRLIINIASGKRTECIIIQHLKKDNRQYNKPLLIHEV